MVVIELLLNPFIRPHKKHNKSVIKCYNKAINYCPLYSCVFCFVLVKRVLYHIKGEQQLASSLKPYTIHLSICDTFSILVIGLYNMMENVCVCVCVRTYVCVYVCTLKNWIKTGYNIKHMYIPLSSLLLGWPSLVMMMFHLSTDIDISEMQCVHSFSSAKKRLVHCVVELNLKI